MNRGRVLVPLALLLFAVLAAFAVQLHDAHEDGRRASERPLEQRAQMSAALTASVFDAVGSLGSDELATELGRSPAARRAYLQEIVEDGRLAYAAVLDAKGEVLARAGSGHPRRTAQRAPRVVSDVHRTAGAEFVEFGLPFTTPGGEHMLVEGVPVSFVRAFLSRYLQRLPNPVGATLVVADSNAVVLARVAPPGAAASAEDRVTAAAGVPRTTWSLRLRADRARVLAGSGGSGWLGWLLLAGLGVAIVAALWLCARTITSSHRTSAANRALRESESRLRALVDALEEAVFLIYADGTIELLNASAEAMLGSGREGADDPADCISVSDDGVPISAAETPAGISLANGTAERRVIGMDRPGRERAWVDVSTRPLFRPGETRPYAVVCSCTDVTARQNLEAHLLDLADRDPLTGLWNRRRFEQDVAHQLDRCRRYGERAALVMMDVDGLEQVNDVLGHLAGDEILCALAYALPARLRTTDRVARLGGDEFGVLLIDVDGETADRLAQELAAGMSAAVTAVQERVSLPISVGTTLIDRCTGGVDGALESADRAVYAAKQDRERRPAASAAPADGSGASPEMASLRALVAAVNARDSYTAMHSREVVTLARAVARRSGLDEARTSEVEHTALLHDLGKIAIPDAILRKAGALTGHEMTLMRQHPVVGAQILESIPELAHLAPTVRAEHERWDGGGYPDGLAGEDIPIASRITLVCDAYHAMTSNRPYRRAMSAAAARDEIRREAGAQFCPHAAAALLDVLLAAHATA